MDSKVILKQSNPYENANIISKTFLWSSFKLFRKNNEHGLNLEDLWKTRKCDRSAELGDRLEKEWMSEIEKAKYNNRSPSLGKAIVSCFWAEYMISGFFFGILLIILWPSIPYTLSFFMEYFSGEKTAETYKWAHIYNIIMNIFTIGTPFLLNHGEFLAGVVGMRVRIACCSLIYRKILKLNRIGSNKTEPGHVINLMSNDVTRFDIASLYLHYIWIMPIVIIIITYLVWQSISWATLAGFAVMFLQTLLVQPYLSNLQANFREKIAGRTDERVKVMAELINGVQVIKMYAWEKPFEKLVEKLRRYEMKFIAQTSMIKGFSCAIIVFTERLILFAAIATFTLFGGNIGAKIAFSLVQYYNILQVACNVYFPWALSFLGESKVSVKRIEDFLMLNEVETEECKVDDVKNGTDVKPKIKQERIMKYVGLHLTDVTASWQANPIVHTLSNITLSAKPGEFVGVTGSVGSGKTTLLHVIMGELQPSRGKLSLGGAEISYASQEPWLFAASVRQNILFGQPYNKSRYSQVVAACALLRDFEQLPAGDGTLVGEKGVSLSGGQRARIGLARACYREADIYLLDDPLSAVDTHVGKHLVTECVTGLLRHSTRILVTHQLHHLKNADKVVILRNGEIESQGTFEEVSRTPLFEQMLGYEENESQEETEDSQTITIAAQANLNKQVEKEDDEDEDAQETEELIEKDGVSSSIYKKFFRAGNSWTLLICTAISILVAQLVTSGADLWLTHWMNVIETRHNFLLVNMSQPRAFINDLSTFNEQTTIMEPDFNKTITNTTTFPYETRNGTSLETEIIQEHLNNDNINHLYYIYIWGAAILGCTVLTSGRSLLFMWTCVRSSVKLHNQMFSNILTTTMRFFDTNPSGRILNRFSKDIGAVDEILPRMFIESIQIAIVMFGILGMVALVSPYMVLTTVICGIFMYYWTVLYLKISQGLKRLEGVSRSPVFSHVSASMAGLTTVRACGAQSMLREQFDDKQDVHTAAWYLTLLTNTSFSVWLSLIPAVYVLIVTYTFLLSDKDTMRSGDVGLAVSQGIVLVNMVQYGMKQLIQVMSQMISVERILEYTDLPQEDVGGSAPPKNWPQQGHVTFKDVYLRYDKESEPVLKNLNIDIQSGWRVGVVGRTGAGKTSLISALFRLAPIDGNIYIDAIDTKNIALKELRSRISIIPQEPVLFSASLRYNLDPFDKYSDVDIWRALEQVELKNSVTSLSSAVESGGNNFSAGQRQLLCLARAALASNRLLVLDEATANVDSNTDALIQKSIRKHFSECTVVTVAHRLHTVADSDRVVVMEAGQVVEFGHPHELLIKEAGPFVDMVKELGPTFQQSIRDLAKSAYLTKIPKRNGDTSDGH